MYTLLIGLEHLQTGVSFHGEAPITVWPENCSPLNFRLYSDKPFKTVWSRINSDTNGAETVQQTAYFDPRVTAPMPESSDYVRAKVERNRELLVAGFSAK